MPPSGYSEPETKPCCLYGGRAFCFGPHVLRIPPCGEDLPERGRDVLIRAALQNHQYDQQSHPPFAGLPLFGREEPGEFLRAFGI